MILVNEHEERNLGVSDLRLASGLSPVNQPLRFEVKVTNHGKEETRDIRVSLNVNGEQSCDEFTIDAIPGGASKSVSLFAKLRSEGFHSVTARIPTDRLPADDSRTVAVRAIKEVRVLLVDGEPGSEPRESETLFPAQRPRARAARFRPGIFHQGHDHHHSGAGPGATG